MNGDAPAPQLDQLALDALRYTPSAAESEAASRPPYPTPAALAPFQQAAQAALRERIGQAPNPYCSRRLYEPAQRFNDSAPVIANSTSGLDVSDMVCALLAGGLISVATAERAVQASAGESTQRFLLRALVYRLLADGDLPAALQAAATAPLGDEQWVAWRAIGEHHAARADAAAFLALWPKYDARRERDWIDTMRRLLVAATTRAAGWRAALALTANKKIGAKGHVDSMIYVALKPLTENTPVAELDSLLATAPELADLDTLDTLARLRLLVDALRASTPRAPADDPAALDAILSRIIAVDPTVSKQQSQRRDWLLTDCWPVIGSTATLKRVRAAVRAPSYKRELTRLAKDLPAPADAH